MGSQAREDKAREDKARASAQELEKRLGGPSAEGRLAATRALGAMIGRGEIRRSPLEEVNNHVHTTFSFSPYEPSSAAWRAWKAGLGIVGSMDHDSVGAAEEMLQASANLGIASTVGFEVRAGFKDTPLSDVKINNPDSKGVIYMCVHGIPRQNLARAKAFLAPVLEARARRNRAMVGNFNALGLGFRLDYAKDVVPLSKQSEGGSVTERHILYALALEMIARLGRGKALCGYLEKEMGLVLPPPLKARLLDPLNVHYPYDLLGVLKSNYMSKFYIQPSPDECPPARQVVKFGLEIGAIPAYAYLGDVADSPTGDKKAERFEDGFLDELLDILVDIGFPAVTYMPPRNTTAQMERLQEGCRRRGLMEISGVDINSSRQSFNCPEMLNPICAHLVDSAWALVAHEKLSFYGTRYGLFAKDNPLLPPKAALGDKIRLYASYGRRLDSFDPFGSARRVLDSLRGALGGPICDKMRKKAGKLWN